jgi:hypothetical protein
VSGSPELAESYEDVDDLQTTYDKLFVEYLKTDEIEQTGFQKAE